MSFSKDIMVDGFVRKPDSKQVMSSYYWHFQPSIYLSLFYWLSIHRTLSIRAIALKRLWLNIVVEGRYDVRYLLEKIFTAPSVESFCVRMSRLAVTDVTDQRYYHLQHHNGYELTALTELPHLKYTCGIVIFLQDF